MPQRRFHQGAEYVVYGSSGEARMEFFGRYKHATVPKFEDDDTLMLWPNYGSQQNFVRDAGYRISGQGGIETKVKYVDRRRIGSRTLLGLRRTRRRAAVIA